MHYYQAARATAAERIPLFRLAWDTALSTFGTARCCTSASSLALPCVWRASFSTPKIAPP